MCARIKGINKIESGAKSRNDRHACNMAIKNGCFRLLFRLAGEYFHISDERPNLMQQGMYTHCELLKFYFRIHFIKFHHNFELQFFFCFSFLLTNIVDYYSTISLCHLWLELFTMMFRASFTYSVLPSAIASKCIIKLKKEGFNAVLYNSENMLKEIK